MQVVLAQNLSGRHEVVDVGAQDLHIGVSQIGPCSGPILVTKGVLCVAEMEVEVDVHPRRGAQLCHSDGLRLVAIVVDQIRGGIGIRSFRCGYLSKMK
jgi:hypothetical protein